MKKLNEYTALLKHFGNLSFRGGKYYTKIDNVETELSPTTEEIDSIVKEQQAIVNKQQAIEKVKKEGLDYTLNNKTYKIPLTSKDAIGMLQVAKAFELGIEETVIWFSNGTKGVIKKDEFEDLAKWFAEKRNLLFTNPEELLSKES